MLFTFSLVTPSSEIVQLFGISSLAVLSNLWPRIDGALFQRRMLKNQHRLRSDFYDRWFRAAESRRPPDKLEAQWELEN